MALSIKTTNLKREQEQSEEGSGTDGQAERERQEEKGTQFYRGSQLGNE